MTSYTPGSLEGERYEFEIHENKHDDHRECLRRNKKRLVQLFLVILIVSLALVALVLILNRSAKNKYPGKPHHNIQICKNCDSNETDHIKRRNYTKEWTPRKTISIDITAPPVDHNVNTTNAHDVELLGELDETVDPCEDFHGFVCNSWEKRHPANPELQITSPFREARKQVKERVREAFDRHPEDNEIKAVVAVRNFYSSCMDIKSINNFDVSTLVSWLDSMGGWPAITPGWNSSQFDWMVPAAQGSLYLEAGAPIMTGVLYDLTNTSLYSIYLGINPFLGLGQSHVYDNPNVTRIYKEFMINVSVEFGADYATARKDAQDIIELEKKILEGTSHALSSHPEKFTISDMNQFGQINFLRLLNMISKEVGVTLQNKSTLYVAQPSNVQRLSQFIEDVDKRTMANMQMWQFVLGYLDTLPENYQRHQIMFVQQLQGKNISPRYEGCITQSKKVLQKPLERLYIDTYLDETARQKVSALTAYIKQGLSELLDKAVWMDDETLNEAHKKLDKITFSIAASNDVMDDELLEEIRGNLTYETNYFQNLKGAVYANKINLGWIHIKNNAGPLDKIRSVFDTTEVNALYFPLKNWVEVTAGILLKPMFDHRYSQAMNFGGIGAILGHELTHAFGVKGRMFDAEGNLRNWWTQSANDFVINRAKCFIDQTNTFMLDKVNKTVNGEITIAETKADDGGIKAAFKAYDLFVRSNGQEVSLQKNYNPQQVFFISFARNYCQSYTENGANILLKDEHPPGGFRILSALSNFPAFADTWKCPSGSSYNPERRCSVW